MNEVDPPPLRFVGEPVTRDEVFRMHDDEAYALTVKQVEAAALLLQTLSDARRGNYNPILPAQCHTLRHTSFERYLRVYEIKQVPWYKKVDWVRIAQVIFWTILLSFTGYMIAVVFTTP